MSKYNIPENNSLKKEIKKLLEMCKKNDKESGAEDSFFEEAIEEQKMTDWEQANGVTIPESYKDWLRFSRKCRIVRNTATFWGPDEFHSDYVPDDLIVIGEMIGDGELVCFSKETGKIILCFEGIKEEKESFAEVLKSISNVHSNKPILTHAEYLEALKKLEELEKMEEIEKRKKENE